MFECIALELSYQKAAHFRSGKLLSSLFKTLLLTWLSRPNYDILGELWCSHYYGPVTNWFCSTSAKITLFPHTNCSFQKNSKYVDLNFNIFEYNHRFSNKWKDWIWILFELHMASTTLWPAQSGAWLCKEEKKVYSSQKSMSLDPFTLTFISVSIILWQHHKFSGEGREMWSAYPEKNLV